MKRTLALASATLALVLVGCGNTGSAPSAPAASADANAPRVAAKDIQFLNRELTVPAAAAFSLVFDNQEAAPHNIAISNAGGSKVFTGEVFTGPAQRTYQVPALPAGSYTFICDVHPNMTGTITAS